ncbi:MAG: penicillin-binding protein 1A, partial [Bacteroidia bacterium]
MSKLNISNTNASKWTKRLWKWFTYSFLFAILFLASIKCGLWGKLPDTSELENPKTKLASEVYSGDSKVLGKMFYQEDRTNSEYADIPQHLKDALIATEDERFYEHSGIDARALTRAIVKLGKDGGGSTVTQQLAKNLFHREEVNKSNRIIQKLKEWILASEIEKRYTKDEI